MKLGLQLGSFTWDGGDAAIAETLAGIVRTADDRDGSYSHDETLRLALALVAPEAAP